MTQCGTVKLNTYARCRPSSQTHIQPTDCSMRPHVVNAMVIVQTKFCVDLTHRHVTTILGFCSGHFPFPHYHYPAFQASPSKQLILRSKSSNYWSTWEGQAGTSRPAIGRSVLTVGWLWMLTRRPLSSPSISRSALKAGLWSTLRLHRDWWAAPVTSCQSLHPTPGRDPKRLLLMAKRRRVGD